MATFIIDCPSCRAKVGADEKAHWQKSQYLDEIGEPYGEKISIGVCPQCTEILVGRAEQIQFKGWEGAEDDLWSDFVRIFPKPPRQFSSDRIPRVLTVSLMEADRSMQAGAPTAACVMFGRALEALCRDMLKTTATAGDSKKERRVTLGVGIRQLRDNKIIDDRLFEWSQEPCCYSEPRRPPRGHQCQPRRC